MSYCRFHENDAYIYMHVNGYLECCACRLTPRYGGSGWYGDFTTTKISEMLNHIKEHRDAGQHIKQYTDERLLREQARDGDDIAYLFDEEE